MSQAHDHEVVSIYPFTDEEADNLLNHSNECVLMWATKDGWPVGVTHAFVWHEGKIWVTFAAHRHRAAAIRRDNRVSVNVSSGGYPPGVGEGLPTGAITFKGRAEFFEDDAKKDWYYRALSEKLMPGNEDGARFFYGVLDSPLRLILSITPEKRIMYNSGMANGHLIGAVPDDQLGERKSGDATRMNEERKRRGLPPR